MVLSKRVIISESHVNRTSLADAYLGLVGAISLAHIDTGNPQLQARANDTGLGTADVHKLDVQSSPREKKPQELDHSQHLKKRFLPAEEICHGKIYERYLYFQMAVSMSSWLHSMQHTWMLLTRRHQPLMVSGVLELIHLWRNTQSSASLGRLLALNLLEYLFSHGVGPGRLYQCSILTLKDL